MSNEENAPHSEELVERSKRWALSNGLVQFSGCKDTVTFIPFTLYPTKLPRKTVQLALDLQTALNELYYNVSLDHSFLLSTLNAARSVDPFIDRLCLIVERRLNKGPVSALISRNDLMIDTNRQQYLSQVEFNTISCAFLALTEKVAELHKGSVQGWEQPAYVVACELAELWFFVHGAQSHLIILFVVLTDEKNFADQLLFEYQLKEKIPESRIFYVSLAEIGLNARVDESGNLFFRDMQVGMVYFRAGYTPEHYPTEVEWKGRTVVEESSNCIVIPTVAMQMAGIKRVQAELNTRNTVEKYLGDAHKSKVNQILSICTGLRSLDNAADISEAKELVENENWLLKPLREGGSQMNISNRQKVLNILDTSAPSKYILQKKISPTTDRNILVFPGRDAVTDTVVSELGVFGVLTSRPDGTVFANSTAGLLLRTKISTVEQGGVATGYSALDSVQMVD